MSKDVKPPVKKARVKSCDKKDGLNNSEDPEVKCYDFCLESPFLLVKSGRLYIQTNKQEEALELSFGRWWKAITEKSNNLSSLCGVSNPTDGLYKIEGKNINKVL
jgi:hypothetical protein